MRIVARYDTRIEADERAAFLRANGIAAHVTGTNSVMRALGLRRDRSQAVLQVMIDAQYDDAVALLADPDHDVGTGLDPEKLEALEAEGAMRAQRLMVQGTIGLVVVLIALVVLLAIVAGG
jgi:hypothetical protein